VKAYRGSGVVDPFILNLSTALYRVVSLTSQTFYLQGKNPLPIEWEAYVALVISNSLYHSPVK